MTVWLSLLVVGALAAPHVVRLRIASPVLGVVIWLSTLVLRALAAAFCAIFAVLFVPTTALFSAVTHWCLHAVVPLLTTHLPLSGHAVGGAALVMPAFVLAVSVLWMGFALWRAARRVRRLLDGTTLGPGPDHSVVLADGDVVVAAAGLRRPRVVVSAGALVALDDEELAASLAHERGHIRHRHRYVLIVAAFAQAVARVVPGTASAARELTFHLERDADRCALAEAHDAAVLASAICKAARPSGPPAVSFGLGGGVVSRRVRLLLGDDRPGRARPQRSLQALAALLLALVAVAAGSLPAAAHAGYHEAGRAHSLGHCPR